MKIKPTTLRPVVMGVLVGLLLTGCASERAKAQAKKEREEKDKYVDYYPTGSNVPIKIPKDDSKTSEAQTDATQEAFRKIQQQNARPTTGPQTGIPGAQSESGTK